MKFNHLNVPTHWQSYWTRFPEGHTILEALISWVSQVDDMVDNQNKLTDNVAQFRNEIDAFIERFEGDLQDEVINTLSDWQKSGFLDVVISEAIQWQLTDYIATNEADKLSLSAQLTQIQSEISDSPVSATSIGITSASTASEIETLLNELTEGTTVEFAGSYIVDRMININKYLHLKGNTATFQFDINFEYTNGNRLVMFNINANNVNFDGFTFQSPSDMVKGSLDNCYIYNNRGYSTITNCKFYDLPIAGSNFNGAIAFLITGGGHNIVSHCYFENCPGSVFSKQPHDIITNCISKNPHDVSFVLNGDTSKNSKITHCTVNNIVNNVSMHIGVEQGVSDFVISGNTIKGIKNGIGIGCINVGGITFVGNTGIISDNIIDGANLVSTNPASGLVVHRYYTNIKVHDNVIKNIGGGVSNSTVVMFQVGDDSHNEFYNNKIINTGTSYPLYIPASGDKKRQLTVRNNSIFGSGAARSVMVTGTDLSKATLKFIDNEFNDTAEGISATSVTSITEMLIKDNKFIAVTNPINMLGIYSDNIQAMVNIYNKSTPFTLSKIEPKKLYQANANLPPTSGDWRTLDEVKVFNPGGGIYSSYLCIASGKPGTWKGKGMLQA